MATTLATPQRRATDGRLADFGNVLRSEFCKLYSIRSTFWTVFTALLSNIVLAALVALFLVSRLSTADRATADPVRLSLAGIHLSQIAFGVLGVLIITSEYGTGMIRATLAAVPQRRLVLTGKLVSFAATALVAGIGSCLAAFFVFEAFLPSGGDGLKASIGDPGVLRAAVGGGLYLTLLGLLGLGLGAVIRASAGAIATLFGLLFVPTILVSLLPQNWRTSIGPYLPMNAGDAIYSLHPEAGGLGPWSGFAVLGLYAAIALTLGYFLIKRRDA
ncbi:ABC-2 type transport system permease protein [Streptacidiphilus sp. MAP12-20]|uniref:ABC transporter permease subunit n=1 Tax=Streptacidiphilus sp. MAP12-20 TaxID=3156299 RepID=UPI0035120B90